MTTHQEIIARKITEVKERRERIATAALQGLLAAPTSERAKDIPYAELPALYAQATIEAADALIAELDK
jgi:hypothetical protein